jgi:hypothetical protein
VGSGGSNNICLFDPPSWVVDQSHSLSDRSSKYTLTCERLVCWSAHVMDQSRLEWVNKDSQRMANVSQRCLVVWWDALADETVCLVSDCVCDWILGILISEATGQDTIQSTGQWDGNISMSSRFYLSWIHDSLPESWVLGMTCGYSMR